MRYLFTIISLIFINQLAFTQNNPTFKVPTDYSIDSLAKLLKIKYYKNTQGGEYWFNENGQRTQRKGLYRIRDNYSFNKVTNYTYNDKGQFLQALTLDNKNDTIYFKYNTYKNDKLKETLVINATKTYPNPKSNFPYYQDLEYTKTTFHKNGKKYIEQKYLSRIISDIYLDLFVTGEIGSHWKTSKGIKVIPQPALQKRWNKTGVLIYEEEYYGFTASIGWGGVFGDGIKKITEYNDCGRVVKVTKDNQLYRLSAYNDDCQLISNTYYKVYSSITKDRTEKITGKSSYFYDKKKRLIKTTTYLDHLKRTKVYEIKYDKKDNLIEKYHYFTDKPDSLFSFNFSIYGKNNQLLITTNGYYLETISYTDSNSTYRKYLIPEAEFSESYFSKKENLIKVDTSKLQLKVIDIYNVDSTFYKQISYSEYIKEELVIRYDAQKREIYNTTNKYYIKTNSYNKIELIYNYISSTGEKILISRIEESPSQKKVYTAKYDDLGKWISSFSNEVFYNNENMNNTKIVTQTYLNGTLPLKKIRRKEPNSRGNIQYVEEYSYNPNYQLTKYESYKLVDGQKANVEIITEYKYDEKGMMIYYHSSSMKQENSPPREWIYEYYD